MFTENQTKPMTGTEIAKKLNISRQAVSNILRRALSKVFRQTKRMYLKNAGKIPNNFEIINDISQMFNVDDDDLKKFYRMFPSEIRKKIKADARRITCNRKT